MWEDILDIGSQCHERFIDLISAPEMAELDIQLAGASNLSGRYCVSRSAPVEHTLFYTLSGQGKLETSTGDYQLGYHTLAVLPANQPFKVTIAAEHWDVIWINLGNTPIWRHLADDFPTILYDQNLEALHHALELVYREPSAILRKSVLPIIEHYLLKTLSLTEGSNDNYRLVSLFNNIEKQLQFNWSIKAMAERVHYSPPHLHRLCLKQFGRSPVQQLIYLRMERAKYLLVNTLWPIVQIAHYVGYQDIFNFSKRFKKSIGVSPSQFRKNQTIV